MYALQEKQAYIPGIDTGSVNQLSWSYQWEMAVQQGGKWKSVLTQVKVGRGKLRELYALL